MPNHFIVRLNRIKSFTIKIRGGYWITNNGSQVFNVCRAFVECNCPSILEWHCGVWNVITRTFQNVHYDDVIMSAIASQITSLTIVYSTVYPGADQSKHQSSASLAFVWGIHRGPVNSPHKWPVTREMFPFDDVIMNSGEAKPRLKLESGWTVASHSFFHA